VVIGFIVTLTMYVTINQYEWIRFLGGAPSGTSRWRRSSPPW
jgi:hypothetical protein